MANFTPPTLADRAAVVDCLKAAGRPLTAHLIARETGIEFLTLCGVAEMGDTSLIDMLVNAGQIRRVEVGMVDRYEAGR